MSSMGHRPLDRDQVRSLLRAHGLRPTRQREVLYSALHATTSHPTAEELFAAVRAVEDGISLATVYNALEAFTDSGLCRRLACGGGGPSRFDADMDGHVHILLDDGRVLDVPQDLGDRLFQRLGPDLIAELEARLGVSLGRVSVQLLAGR